MTETQAHSLFAEYLARRENGEDCSFEEFCDQHLEHQSLLRALHEDYLLIQRARQNAVTLMEMAPQNLSTIRVHGRDSSEAWQVLLARLNERTAAHRRYRIEGDSIGRGGMGEVFRAIDLDTLRVVALKRIRRDLLRSTSEEDYRRLRARFLEEAQIQAQLDHPGIAPLHEMGVDSDGGVFFTMKFVKGDSFKAFLREAALGPSSHSLVRSITILREVCETVAFAHSKGVIHRDLKPENIMLGAFGETYVMDWGLAKLLTNNDPDREHARIESGVRTSASTEIDETVRATLTGQDQKLGTPYFMSPEQAAGDHGRIGPPTDIYAAGAILYTALAGEPPYHDSSTPKTAFEVIDEVRHGPPRPISRAATGAPPELSAICEKAMARRPEDRYESMLDLANDLRAYLENRVVMAHTTGTWKHLRKWVSRNRLKVATVAAATIAFIGTAFWLFEFQSRRALELEQSRTEHALKEQIQATLRADQASQRAIDAEQKTREEAREAERQKQLAEINFEKAIRATAAAEHAQANEQVERRRAQEAAVLAQSEKSRAERALEEQQELRKAAEVAKEQVEQANRKLESQELEIASLLIRARILQTEQLLRHADTLWPPKIRLIDEYEAWLAQAEAIQNDRNYIENRVPRLSASDQEQARVLLSLLDRLSGQDNRANTQLSVSHRLERARVLAQAQESSAKRWESILASLANKDKFPIYKGLRIEVQDELVPVSTEPNPLTGCFEFYSPLTGSPPNRNAKGIYDDSPGSSLVFVLIPPGSCVVGIQNRFPDKRNYSVHARPIELPKDLNATRVEAFFVSRSLVSNHQFALLTMQKHKIDPKREHANGILTHISWDDANSYLLAWGMRLPTEIQWEYLSRSAAPLLSDVWDHSLAGTNELWTTRVERAWGLKDFSSGISEWVVSSHDLYFGSGYLGASFVLDRSDAVRPPDMAASDSDLVEHPTEYFAELELSEGGQITTPERISAHPDGMNPSFMMRYRAAFSFITYDDPSSVVPQVCRGGISADRSDAGVGLRDFRAGSIGYSDCGIRPIIQPTRIP